MRSIAGGLGRGFVLVAFVAGCSTHREDPSSAPDASASMPLEQGDDARRVADAVLSVLSPSPALAARFAPNPDGFVGSKDGVVSPGWRGAWTDRARNVGARLPARSDRPIEAGIGVSELYRLSLTQVGAKVVSLSTDAGRAVYRDVYPSTDVTFVASPERLEWAYTLRDEKAPTSFELEVTLPKNLPTVRVGVRGDIEFVDASGDALLRIPRAVAIDAAGATRDANIRWDHGKLVVKLDTSGLRFPIVLDPSLETSVWQARVQNPTPRYGQSAAYDSNRKRVVMFGGLSGSDETWEWDGAVWSLRSTGGGPAGRMNAAMTFDPVAGVTLMSGGGSFNDLWAWNGLSWTELCNSAPCSSKRPSGRYGAGMVYMPTLGKTVLFGGLSSPTYLDDTWMWNGSEWTSLAVAGPSGRVHHGMTWDAKNKQVLLFGGQTGTSSFSNELWSFDGTAWSKRSTLGTPPSERAFSLFVNQENVNKTLMFAGAGIGTNNDTWELDNDTYQWVELSVTNGPQGRYRTSTGVWDSARNAVLMFGGLSSTGWVLADTWQYKSISIGPLGTSWTRTGDLLGDRTDAATAFDAARGRIVLFGGRSVGQYNGETWEWNGFEWVAACKTAPCSATTPAPRRAAVAGYDPVRKRVILFGGIGTALYSDTWEYDGNTWTQRCTSGFGAGACNLSPRAWHVGAFDSFRQRFVVFSGNGPGTNDTWEWNGTSWTQTCLAGSCGTLPVTRQNAAMAYDPDNKRIVMFGGGPVGAGDPYGDTWAYNGTSWTQIASTGPEARTNSKLTWDSVRKKLVLFGGTLASGAQSAETWELSGSTWTRTATSGPVARAGHSFEYDAARRRAVMQGGYSFDAYLDTWEYYSRGGDCSSGTQCATGYCVDGVCCEALSCGTCQACNTVGGPGQCVAVTGGDDPDTCPASTKTCDSTGACKLRQAQACTSSLACASGACANGYCCDTPCTGGCDVCDSTPGTCTLLAKWATGSSCGPYLCNGAAGECPTSCAVDGDCASTHFCDSSGQCQLRRSGGAGCNTATGGDCKVSGCRECGGTLTCKDGYCCNTACAGTCQTCAASPGTCTTLTNAKDADTCTGANTCSPSGACLLDNGQSCATDSQCAGGKCIDNFCCNSGCSGGCDVCNATPGVCTVLSQGSAGVACGGYVCNGSSGVCPTSCANDADCASTHFCAAGATCQPRKAQGSICNQAAGSDCKSAGCRVCGTGNCIDGFCCDSACGGACDACNGAALGWSGAVNGACALAPLSHPGTPTCLGYACNGTSASCATGCTSDAQCATGYFCNAAGSCVAQKPQGTACNLATDCRSGACRACATGNCVDGFCCNTACGGQCQACDVGGAQGTCVTVTGAVHVNPAIASRTVCAGAGPCASTCNGVDASACKYPGAAIACGTTSCSAGLTTNVGTCNGAGVCNQPTTPCGAYACGATTCKTSCATEADCASSGYYCVGGACTPKKPAGESCASASACVSGNCVDGVCCGSASCDVGHRCNLVGTLGKCAKANGTACTSSTECGSGFCVDSVCCDTACLGQCAACDVTGKVGTCSAVSGSPHGARSACAGAGAGGECGPVCDGVDTAACHAPTGAKSCGANTCTKTGGSYVETHVSVCNGAGACSDDPKTCGGFTCGASACKASCTASTDCTAGYYCKSGACIPIEGLGTTCTGPTTCATGFCVDGVCCAQDKCDPGKSCSAGVGVQKGFCTALNGTSCSADTECVSGVCVDGVCCDSACTGSCEVCNKAGSIGKCVPIVGMPAAGHPPCTGASTDADCAARCDGTDGAACKYPGTTTLCGKPSCGGGAETPVSNCNGAGTCKPATKACAPYVCAATACLTSCTKNDDCAKGNYCKAGACVKVEGLGKACGGPAECDSGFCADGVCCLVATCGEGSSCAAADSTTPGVCLKKRGVACAKADDCATGRCVDGVCCDLACDGQCEACDLGGSEGTCTPVVGAPHGKRALCDDKDAKDCAKAQCDGKTRDKCGGFVNGGTTACGVDSCTADKRFQKRGTCDGVGGCALPEPKPCTPYACDAKASTGCKSSCAADVDCADGFSCDAGACVQGAKCSEDRSASISKGGDSTPCKPYRCGSDGKCATSCGSSEDCAAGTVCDTSVKACVVLQVEAGEGDGGCSQGARGARSPVGLLVATTLLGWLRRRRATRGERA